MSSCIYESKSDNELTVLLNVLAICGIDTESTNITCCLGDKSAHLNITSVNPTPAVAATLNKSNKLINRIKGVVERVPNAAGRKEFLDTTLKDITSMNFSKYSTEIIARLTQLHGFKSNSELSLLLSIYLFVSRNCSHALWKCIQSSFDESEGFFQQYYKLSTTEIPVDLGLKHQEICKRLPIWLSRRKLLLRICGSLTCLKILPFDEGKYILHLIKLLLHFPRLNNMQMNNYFADCFWLDQLINQQVSMVADFIQFYGDNFYQINSILSQFAEGSSVILDYLSDSINIISDKIDSTIIEKGLLDKEVKALLDEKIKTYNSTFYSICIIHSYIGTELPKIKTFNTSEYVDATTNFTSDANQTIPDCEEEEDKFYGKLVDLSGQSKVKPVYAVDNISTWLNEEVEVLKTGDDVDSLALKLIYYCNCKENRKAVGKILSKVHKIPLSTLPLFARLLANLSQCHKDISIQVVECISNDLDKYIIKKAPTEIECKTRTVRYACELYNFKLIPAGLILDIFAQLIDSFSSQHAILCAHICQAFGARILRCRGTVNSAVNIRFTNLLLKLKRLYKNGCISSTVEVFVEDAIAMLCKSANANSSVGAAADLQKSYIHHIITNTLLESTAAAFSCLRRLDWDDPKVSKWLKKRITCMYYGDSFDTAERFAELLSFLVKKQPMFVIDCIDTVFDNLQLLIENPLDSEAANGMRLSRFIGELYIYRIIDSNVVFDTLFHLIGFGGLTSYGCGSITRAHEIRSLSENGLLTFKSTTSPIYRCDESQLCIFIRMACGLVESVGKFFTRGLLRNKMYRFITFLLHLTLSLNPVPILLHSVIIDIVSKLDANYLSLKSIKSARDSNRHIERLLAKEEKVIEQLNLPLGSIKDELFNSIDTGDYVSGDLENQASTVAMDQRQLFDDELESMIAQSILEASRCKSTLKSSKGTISLATNSDKSDKTLLITRNGEKEIEMLLGLESEGEAVKNFVLRSIKNQCSRQSRRRI